MKFIFPELRRLCESRGVTWREVDLCGGVTDIQKAKGKVLPICLEQVKRGRPRFIGPLGRRYDWVPEPRHFRDTTIQQVQPRSSRQ